MAHMTLAAPTLERQLSSAMVVHDTRDTIDSENPATKTVVLPVAAAVAIAMKRQQSTGSTRAGEIMFPAAAPKGAIPRNAISYPLMARDLVVNATRDTIGGENPAAGPAERDVIDEITDAKEHGEINALIYYVSRWVSGDCPAVSEWVDRQPNWLCRVIPFGHALRFFETTLRTFGALIFVNNVWSGILLFIACLYDNFYSALVGILGIIVSRLTQLLLNTPIEGRRSGVANFNAFMVAQFVATNGRPFAPERVYNPWLIFPALFFAAISALVVSSLHALLDNVKIPALNFPFSIVSLIFLAGQAASVAPIFPAFMSPLHAQFNNLTINSTGRTYDNDQITLSIFYSMNNIYGCETIVAACLIWIAVFISSRLLFAMFIVGSCVGTGISVALGVSARQLATGMWSYDSLQVCGSIGGIFYVWNKYSCVMAIFAAGVAAVVSGFMYHVLGFVKLPFQGFPLCLTDAVFILALDAYHSRRFVRVSLTELRYPEKHRAKYFQRRKLAGQDDDAEDTKDIFDSISKWFRKTYPSRHLNAKINGQIPIPVVIDDKVQPAVVVNVELPNV